MSSRPQLESYSDTCTHTHSRLSKVEQTQVREIQNRSLWGTKPQNRRWVFYKGWGSPQTSWFSYSNQWFSLGHLGSVQVMRSFLRRWPKRSNLWLEFCPSNLGTCRDREQRMLATHGPLLFNAAGGGWNETTMGVVVGCNRSKCQQLSLRLFAFVVTDCDL